MRQRVFTRTLNLCLAAALALHGIGPAMATPADDLKDLVGVKGGSAEGDLESRGYTHVDTNKSSTAAYSYWWSNAKSSCIRVTTRDGHWQTLIDVDPSDCGQTKKESGMSDDAKVAIGAAALLGIAALAHKSHHRDDRRYDEQQTADFERGYRDGLYNNSFHNYSNSSEYNDGYNRGVEERDQNSGYRHNNWSRGDYASNSNWGGGGDSQGWDRCAREGDRCDFSGRAQVRYGTSGRFYYRNAWGGVRCDNNSFGGDPYPNRPKSCEIRR